MDDLDLIAQVLCHFDLPDAEVYACMASLRDALKTGQGVEGATLELESRFRTCVALGLNLSERANPWVHLAGLAENAELRERLELRALGSGSPQGLYRRDPLAAKVELVRILLDRLKFNDLEVRATLAQAARYPRRPEAQKRVLDAFRQAVLENLGHGREVNIWIILSRRPELRGEPELLSFIELLAREQSPPPAQSANPLSVAFGNCSATTTSPSTWRATMAAPPCPANRPPVPTRP
jgi:hypothetical protein